MALIAAKSLSIVTLILAFIQVPQYLLKKFRQSKVEFPSRLLDMVDALPPSTKQSQCTLFPENLPESSDGERRVMYVDLTEDGELNPQTFDYLKRKLGKSDILRKTRYVGIPSGRTFCALCRNSFGSSYGKLKIE